MFISLKFIINLWFGLIDFILVLFSKLKNSNFFIAEYYLLKSSILF